MIASSARETMAMARVPPELGAAAGFARRIVLDVSRLLEKSFQLAPTGIDRVELAYARHFLAHPTCNVRFVASLGGAPRAVAAMPVQRLAAAKDKAWREGGGRAADASWKRLCRFLGAASEGEADVREADSAFAPASSMALRAASPLAAPPPGRGEPYLNVSHQGIDRPALRRWLGTRSGVFLLHDLIPISCPEYVRRNAPLRHAERLATIEAHAGLVLTNSGSTRDAWLSHGGAGPHAAAVPLGIEPSFRRGVTPLAGAHPYFVCVATIEPRKNHVFLLQLWQRLAAKLGEQAPRLLLVGRRGWENENAIDMIERAAGLRTLVHETGALPDRALARVIAGARALVLPSLAEGFGLPVAEALALGVPVLASDLPALREVSGGLAEHLDPLDGRAWLEAFADYAKPGSRRRAAGEARAAAYRAPRWDRHFAIVDGLLGLAPAMAALPC